jgi:hypothetical protein
MISNPKWMLIVCLAALLAPAVTRADSLEDKRRKTEMEDKMGKDATSLERVCKSKIELVMDWGSWSQLRDDHGNTPYSACQPTWSTVESMCHAKDAQEVIAKDIRRIECKGGGTDGDNHRAPDVRLNGTTLVFRGTIVSHTYGGDLRKYLEKNLK